MYGNFSDSFFLFHSLLIAIALYFCCFSFHATVAINIDRKIYIFYDFYFYFYLKLLFDIIRKYNFFFCGSLSEFCCTSEIFFILMRFYLHLIFSWKLEMEILCIQFELWTFYLEKCWLKIVRKLDWSFRWFFRLWWLKLFKA